MGITGFVSQVKFWMGRNSTVAPVCGSETFISRLARMLKSGNQLIPPSVFQPAGMRKLIASMLLMPGSLIPRRVNFIVPDGAGAGADLLRGFTGSAAKVAQVIKSTMVRYESRISSPCQIQCRL